MEAPLGPWYAGTRTWLWEDVLGMGVKSLELGAVNARKRRLSWGGEVHLDRMSLNLVGDYIATGITVSEWTHIGILISVDVIISALGHVHIVPS